MKKLNEILSFRGRRCLVTGAANGIGKAVAYRLAEAGSSLVLVDIDELGLNEVKHELSSLTHDIRTFQVDLSVKKDIERLWFELGALDVDTLINNAGMYPFMDFLSLTEEDLNRVMDLNLNSVIWMCQEFIKRRTNKGGSIVNLGSIEAILPFKKDLTQYSLSKVGVITLTRDLAREFANKNIRVNAVLPGGIRTEGTKKAAVKAVKELDIGLISDGYNFKQRIPAGRLGKPDEVAKVILALCSDLCSYMHGALVPVDGGFLSS